MNTFPVNSIHESDEHIVKKRKIINFDTEWTALEMKTFLRQNKVGFYHNTTMRYDQIEIFDWIPISHKLGIFDIDEVDYHKDWYFQHYYIYYKKNDKTSQCQKVIGMSRQKILTETFWEQHESVREKITVLFKRNWWS